jgi:uncharacterized damage-inducible protein DinB
VTTSQQGSTAQAKPKASIIFATNNRMYQMILEHLDGSIWRTKPAGDVRTIAAIFTHVHNVRSKWVRLTAPHLKVPALLNRAHCTPTEARAGFDESAARCVEMLAEALDGGNRIKTFQRDGWAKVWPVGIDMLCYMLAHEAHHRGQILMLTHQLGSPLPRLISDGMWNWERLWKESGSAKGLRHVDQQ